MDFLNQIWMQDLYRDLIGQHYNMYTIPLSCKTILSQYIAHINLYVNKNTDALW